MQGSIYGQHEQALMVIRDEYIPIIVNDVHHKGFCFVPRWNTGMDTLDVARTLGDVICISDVVPGSRIPTVQIIKPRVQTEAPPNQYSTEFGLDGFPFHTDLAHWFRPPRYFMLRCSIGSSEVQTLLMPCTAALETLGSHVINRALVLPRRPPVKSPACLLPVVFNDAGLSGIRWDSVFLRPINNEAKRVALTMKSLALENPEVLHFTLVDPGDTLLVDNWRYFHSRSKVPSKDSPRKLERVYLSRI